MSTEQANQTPIEEDQSQRETILTIHEDEEEAHVVFLRWTCEWTLCTPLYHIARVATKSTLQYCQISIFDPVFLN